MEYGLSLGSNLGDRIAVLADARDRIAQIPGVDKIQQSSIYETEPVGVKPKYRNLLYLNAVLVISASIRPEQMSNKIHAIEDALGRVRSEDRFAPRIIDIDILYAGSVMLDDHELTLPHPRWAERRFVVQPLSDLRPDLVFPGSNQTVKEILRKLPGSPKANLFRKNW
jgi:2-amino-4-hydroxy-6-hydroxymethyldihydropteridine diphosphokinase